MELLQEKRPDEVFSKCHSDVPQLLLKFAKFKVQPEK